VTTAQDARAAAKRAADSPALDRLARVGLACRGVLYALIGVLAIQIALGDGGGEQADKGGAITTVAHLPFGAVILWVMVVGFSALALWQASEALFGHLQTLDRAEAAGRTAVYALIVFTLVSVLTVGRAASEDQKSQDVTGSLLDLPAGQWLVGLIGVGILALGVYWVRQGVTKKFRRELELGRMTARTRSVMEKLGLAGYVARGAIAGLAGIFVVQAAVTHDADKAGGIDATLRAFADTPAGPWLLVAVALGLMLFAGYCFGESRWRRT
jgi:fumarate reductase subunit D